MIRKVSEMSSGTDLTRRTKTNTPGITEVSLIYFLNSRKRSHIKNIVNYIAKSSNKKIPCSFEHGIFCYCISSGRFLYFLAEEKPLPRTSETRLMIIKHFGSMLCARRSTFAISRLETMDITTSVS